MKVKIVKKNDIKDIEWIIEYLKDNNVEISDDINDVDILLSLGGDGTILSLVDLLCKKNVPVFSVNYGNVGYMTKVSKDSFKDNFDRFLKGEYRLEHRDFLEIEFKNEKYYALNELSILKNTINSKLIKINAYQEDKLINVYRGDGVIVSTPTGSTAYSLSANGPIIHPELKAICITPLAPQTLSARSIILQSDKYLYFSVEDESVGINVDGRLHLELKKGEFVKARLSDFGIDLICIEDTNYFDVLKEKLHWS